MPESSVPDENVLDDLPPELWAVDRLLAVVAHPDDESFGLGGVLGWLTARGIEVDLLCFTAGEASTVGATAQLGVIRAGELEAAASVLGVRRATIEGLADGHLAEDPTALEALIERSLGGAGGLVCLEPSGVTGHPDHKVTATAVEKVAARAGVPVLEWGLSPAVAAALHDEIGAPLSALDGADVVEIRVPRDRQRAAIACHLSQDPTNALLTRRLELQGAAEHLRIRSAPFEARLARFVSQASSLAHLDAEFSERKQLLECLVGFTAGKTWPSGAFDRDPDRPYGVHCLHDDPAGWTLATIVLEPGEATPPHDHESWGAAATVSGLERNVRFAGRCPDDLRPLDAQLAPRGAGYLFAAGDIHQASSAGRVRSVSVHLLIGGGDHALQHCREPAAERPAG